MDAGIKKQWVEALRSGNYVQGTRRLRGGDDTFCCLGVLCDLAERAGVVSKTLIDTHVYIDTQGEYAYYPPSEINREGGEWESKALPEAVAQWAGIEGVIETNLVDSDLPTLNDRVGADFNAIADVIEKEM